MPADRSRRPSRQDEDGLDEEEYPPWAGMGIIPRYADHGERERRRLGLRDVDDVPGVDDAPGRSPEAGRSAKRDRAAEGGRPAEGRRRAPGRRGADGGLGADSGREADGGFGADSGRGVGGGADRPDGPLRAPGRSRTRAAAGRIRRGRRTIWFRAGAIVVVIVLGVVGWFLFGGPSAPTTPSDGLVTTFQPGELTSVPDTCSAVSTATLDQYVPGNRRTVAPHSLFGHQQSLCVWSVDAHPVYRWLQASVQAYAPNGLANGNGSATSAAIDAYQQALAGKTHPAKQTHQAPAQVTAVGGLGQSAFVATQRPTSEGATTYMVTVLARSRNALVTVVFEGLVTKDGRYGPVSLPQLQAGAIAVTRELLSRLG